MTGWQYCSMTLYNIVVHSTILERKTKSRENRTKEEKRREETSPKPFQKL